MKEFGQVHISGSYDLNLMTWRDLDIYLEVKDFNEEDFFILGSKINQLFHPIKMSYRNEILKQTKGLPYGLYWGIYLGNERQDAWKIDVWAMKSDKSNRLLNYSNEIKLKLNAGLIDTILEIKAQCWQDSNYRKTYTSIDIYTAVIEKNLTTYEEFISQF